MFIISIYDREQLTVLHRALNAAIRKHELCETPKQDREHELLCELSSQVQQLVHSSRHSAPNVIHVLDAIMANQNLVQAIAEEKTKECEALYEALNTITHRDTECNSDHGIYNQFMEGTDLTDYIGKEIADKLHKE